MTIPAPREELSDIGGSLSVSDYLDFLEREYLTTYVAHGGSAIKLMTVGNDTTAGELSTGLARLGDRFPHVALDAATTRIHLIDQVFGAVARQVNWVALAESVVRRAYDQAGFPAPDKDEVPTGTPLSIDTVAGYHGMDRAELYRNVRRALERIVLNDTTLSHEFRVAMLRLCQERLSWGDTDEDDRDTVLGWLRGDKVPAAALRKVSLYSKVARHNARPLLVSLTRWVRRAGLPGLVLQLDLERLAVARRPPAGLRDGHYYSKAATLDVYEVLRQLIDATDEMDGLFVAVLLPSELVSDETRGLPAYSALQLRVADEVRDRRRPNPYATLVRLGTRVEATR